MSDYSTEANISRDDMANMLAGNEEQLAYVLSEVLTRVDIDDVLMLGNLGDEAEPDVVRENLDKISNAIKLGHLA